jgi:16S rRNA processing protein RimM
MVVLGRLVAPYGVQGWMHLHPFGDDPESWKRMPQWWLSRDDGEKAEWVATDLKSLRLHGGGWVAKLDGIDTRADAEAKTGWYFAAPREALPAAKEGEYYWTDLIGLKVLNTEGTFLGVVQALIETGANDVLKVKDGDTERLLPFVSQIVTDVNVANGEITVDWQGDW